MASIDRLARSVVDLEALVDELTGRGVTVEFVDRHLVFAPGREDGHAVFQRQVIAAVAQLERTILKERQREGIEAAKARGVYKGRKPALTPDQVQQVRARHGSGETMVRPRGGVRVLEAGGLRRRPCPRDLRERHRRQDPRLPGAGPCG